MKSFLKFLLFFSAFMGLYGGNFLHAQKQGQAAIDSLLKELPKQKEDTSYVKLLINLSSGYWRINPNEGIKYGQQGLELAIKLHWEKGMAICYNEIGVNFLYKSDYQTALDYYLKSLKISERTGDKKSIAGVTCNIGIIHDRLSDYPKALEYYFRALKIDEEIGNKRFTANVTGNIGTIYRSLKDYPKALEYTLRQLKINEEMGDKMGVSNAINNIGVVYYYQGDYPKALEYYFRALKMYEEMGIKYGISNVYESIGNVYTVQKNFTMAIEYMMNALRMQEEIGDRAGMASDLTNIGIAYVKIVNDTAAKPARMTGDQEFAVNKYKPTTVIPAGRSAQLRHAIDYLQRGLEISKEIRSPNLMQDCYEYLAQAYKLSGDFKKALEFADNYQAIKDSIFSKDNNEQIVKLSMKNEYDRQHLADSLKTAEREKIAYIKLQRQRGFTVMGIVGILLLGGFSFFISKERRRSEQERKKSDELLLNILPGEIANELKANGITKARHYENVTVLFTDFVNFTSAGERMSPQALIDELHYCFRAFDEITGRHNIEKIKTIGDAYLAVAGLPAADIGHAEKTVRAAIEMNEFMQDRIAKLGDRTFGVRIGVHSGSVVAGIVGVKKFAYDIWGDTVNTAARMEQNSEAGKINISQSTYQLVKDKFACEYRGEIEAKNKGRMKMYFVSTNS